MQMLSRQEVARTIGLSERTLDRMTRAGTGPRAWHFGTRRILFRADDVAAWLEALPVVAARSSAARSDGDHLAAV